jgi:predicted ferric reductase
VFFFLGAFHFFFIAKPFSNFDPLGLYVSAFCALGILSYIWMSVVRPMAPRGHRYEVDLVRRVGGLTELVLLPKGGGMRHKPGQFAFLSIDGGGLGEEHPFTLSGAPTDDRVLRFSIKDLGDYTDRLQRMVQPGMDAIVSGPFGHFSMPSGRDPQVWIGAGVGITPFLAFAESLKDRETGPVKLYYCIRERDDIPYAVELERLAEEVDTLELIIVNSAEGIRLTSDRIVSDLGGDVANAHVFFCGPLPMRKALKSGLLLKGLKASRFRFEEFEMRTGIGLQALAVWLWDRGKYEVVKRVSRQTEPAE